MIFEDKFASVYVFDILNVNWKLILLQQFLCNLHMQFMSTKKMNLGKINQGLKYDNIEIY